MPDSTSRSGRLFLATALICLLLVATLGVAVVALMPDERRSTRDGVYSANQAERGEKVYKTRCQLCHQPDQYVGPVFMKGWSGQTADALFDLVRTTMPKDNPGGLKPQEYADVIAFIFKLNGLPAGDAELKGTKIALKQVLIEEPKEKR